jgi:uncharacterized protein (DUF934 family)
MATLMLRTREFVADTWQRIERRSEGERIAVPIEGDLLVPLEVWLAERETLANPPGRIGLWLDSNADLDLVARDIARFRIIAVHLPVFSDGRAFSLARLLRGRHGFRGELRAFGDVRRDQLFYLARCGFDSFELAPGQDPVDAVRALSEFDTVYQFGYDAHLALQRRTPKVAESLPG